MAISRGKSEREKTFVLHICILIIRFLYNNRTKKKKKTKKRTEKENTKCHPRRSSA